jgi:RsmE family RNA methyltransferase
MQDLTRETIQDRYPDIPVIAPQRAAEHLFRIACENDFSLYEFFQTDVAGHSMDYARACAVLRVYDAFLAAFVRSAEVAGIAPDHAELIYRRESDPPPAPPLTLVIALQRPQTFSKVIHSAVTLGIKQIHFIHTFKVEKSYWQSSRLSAENLQEEIDLALEQAADPVEPQLFFHKRFKIFAEDELEAIAHNTCRLVGDPAGTAPVPMPGTPVTLALGPEGGFTDYELNTLKEHGFSSMSLGSRILRTEFALAALLGKLLL